ncbi:hypothetical protein M3Y99_00024100 [Aphelenchoides fujianensis]|nr:hypothetical protein M3Y99_00024100 [Aphelenchoides fujianensis]
MTADEKEASKLEFKMAEEKVDDEKPAADHKLRTLYSFADGACLGLIGILLALVQAAPAAANEENELPFNLTALDAAYDERQATVDAKFHEASSPVFIAMISLSLATFIAAFIQRLVWEFSGIRQVFRARKAYIRKLLHMDVAWLESRHSGQIASTLHDHADSIYRGVADHVPMTIFIFSYLAVTLGVCFYIQWDVTLVMLLALPVLIGTRMIFSKWFMKTMDAEFQLQSKMSNLVSETFSCIRTVISFGAQRQTLSKYERLAHQNQRLTEERLRASSVYDALAQVLFTELIFTAALCYGMWRMGGENAGRLGALAINMLYVCVTSITIGFHLNGVSTARQNASAMQQILSETPLIEVDCTPTDTHKKDEEKAEAEKKLLTEFTHDGAPAAPRFRSRTSASRTPLGRTSRFLKDVTLEIKAGEHVAIVGSSGSGKSTLTALALRFYDPMEGSGITTITIAHRLTTVKKCDRIIVLEAGKIVEEGTPEQLLSNAEGRFYRMYADQKLDALELETPKRRLMGKLSIGASESNQLSVDPDQRRAWARSSLGPNRRLGKSYSMLSTDRLNVPMSKKRGNTFKANVMEVAAHDKRLEEEETSLIIPKRRTSFSALLHLIRNYRPGYVQLASAIPTTILRGLFFLLVCFEVASILELTMSPPDEIPQRLFYVAAIYISLIIIKTIFEAVGRLVVALYGHGFCAYLRKEMFRKLLRHGAAYFDEEGNTPGRLTHKMINDTASLQAILGDKLDLLLPAIVCSTVSISVALWINWKLALLCAFQFPAYFFFRIVELHEAGTRQRRMAEEEKKAANLATVVLSNMSTIKAYTLQSHFPRDLPRRFEAVEECDEEAFSFSYILIAVTLYFGKDMMFQNEITPFDYLRVVLLTQFGANFISQLIASIADFSKARIAAENIMEVLREPAVDMDNLSDQGLQPTVAGRLTLQNVEFRYPSPAGDPRPQEAFFSSESGRVCGDRWPEWIVSPPSFEEQHSLVCSSGKSSIIALLQRLYSPTEGKVFLDKSSIRSINPGYLRRKSLYYEMNQMDA